MLSKEEIEKAIERLKYINMAYDCCNYYSRYDLDCIETLLQYIEQLETNNKKLIEKLEEVKQENKQLKEQDNNIILQQIFNALYNNETKSKLDKILEIAKGEKE